MKNPEDFPKVRSHASVTPVQVLTTSPLGALRFHGGGVLPVHHHGRSRLFLRRNSVRHRARYVGVVGYVVGRRLTKVDLTLEGYGSLIEKYGKVAAGFTLPTSERGIEVS